MNRISVGLLLSTFLLAGCGGGSSSPMPVSPVVPQQHFAVPQALKNFVVPPAPPSTIPAKPTSAQRALIPHAAPDFVPKKREVAAAATASPDPIVRFATNYGDIDVELRPDASPKNVANFLSYVNSGAYASSIVHRSLPNFVIQGGGYTVNSNTQFSAIPTNAAVVNEFNLSNVRGTLAMSKAGNDPNSATSQWFFNQIDNSASLDSQDGGFTVIGSIVSSQGLAVMDAIGQVPVPNPPPYQAPLDQMPIANYTQGAAVKMSDLVNVTNVTVQPSHPAFFDGEVNVGNAVEYLTFPSGNYFGYYSYLSDPNYIYHFDLGYEYVFDANDGQDGVYFYDFTSGHYFYTSPSFPFPYVYDFSLKAVLYYYPNTSSAGHYTTNPRYFYNFNTGAIFTE